MAEGAAEASAKKIRKVLIAVDPSDESTYALTWALENVVQPTGDKVHLLHAQGYPHVYAGPAGPGEHTPAEERGAGKDGEEGKREAEVEWEEQQEGRRERNT